MSASICNADVDHHCDANDGEPCARCISEHEYWRALWEATPASVRRLDRMTPADLSAELREAGRGHLAGDHR